METDIMTIRFATPIHFYINVEYEKEKIKDVTVKGLVHHADEISAKEYANLIPNSPPIQHFDISFSNGKTFQICYNSETMSIWSHDFNKFWKFV